MIFKWNITKIIPRIINSELPEPEAYVLVWNYKQQMWKSDHYHAGSVSWCDSGMFSENLYWLPMLPAPTYAFSCKDKLEGEKKNSR